MDEVIQYRKDQKAGSGRMVYKGVKLNNRTMHNFRPTIGNIIMDINQELSYSILHHVMRYILS